MAILYISFENKSLTHVYANTALYNMNWGSKVGAYKLY